MSEEKPPRNPWPGYPRRFALGVARIVEVSVEDDGGAAYKLCVDAEHESVELPCRTLDLALRSFSLEHMPDDPHLVVDERKLVDAIGDVLQLGRRAAFTVDVRKALDELMHLQRGVLAWLSGRESVELAPEEVADLLNCIARATKALGGEVPRG